MSNEQAKRGPGHRIDPADFDAHEGTAPHLDLEPEAQVIQRLSRGPTNRRKQRKDPDKHPRNITAVLSRGLQFVMCCHPNAVTFLYGRPARVNQAEAEYLAQQCDAVTFDDPETGGRVKKYFGKFTFKGADGQPIDFPVPEDRHLGDAHLSDVDRAMIARRNRGRRAA